MPVRPPVAQQAYGLDASSQPGYPGIIVPAGGARDFSATVVEFAR